MSITDERLKRVLHSAYYEVPYYNNVINSMISESDVDDDQTGELDSMIPKLFSEMPIFDKRKLIEVGWENCVSNRYLDENYRPILTHARMERTSGTSGPAMSILWNDKDFWASNRFHWNYRYQHYGITPSSKMCTTAMRVFEGDVCKVEKEGNILKFSTLVWNQDTVTRIFEWLHTFRPEWFYLSNSALYVLVRYAKLYHLEFPDSIRYIEYIGEPLCPYYRKEIEKVLPVPTSNMYGCVETNGIAYECEDRNLHILPENIYAEIVDENGKKLPEGEIGYVCVTGLHNTAMPMLRYRLNDRARILPGRFCSCGNPAPVLDLHAARIPEYLVLDDPSVFPDATLYHPFNCKMDMVTVEHNDILFHFRMDALDHYEVFVYQNPKGIVGIDTVLRGLFDAYGLPDVRFTVKAIDEPSPSRPAGLIRINNHHYEGTI